MAKEPKPPKPAKASRMASIRQLVDAVAGARLCYGDPVTAGDRTVIPVARVRVVGGGGFGSGRGGESPTDEGQGGGGGGYVDAQPLGYVEVGPEGTRYVEIPDPERVQRTMKAGAAAITTLAAGLAGARRLRGARRRPAGLLRG